MTAESLSAEWRTVPEFPDYEVSNAGQIRRRVPSRKCPGGYPAGRLVANGRWRRSFQKQDGSISVYEYPMVSLYNGPLRRKRKVHQIVASAFLGPRPGPTYQVAHNDGNPLNNDVDNLRWCTPSENQADRNAHGTCNRGSRHGMSKLTEDDVRLIRRRLQEGHTQRAVAVEFGINPRYARALKTGAAWKHVI